MHKKLLILSPNFTLRGQPVAERTLAYDSFFKSNSIETKIKATPKNIFELMYIIKYIYKNNFNNILITMPPFRNWCLLLLPKVNTILDIRDGWSIAMKSGYGGTVKPNIFKASITRMIEYIGIKLSILTITCTPGLQQYLQNLTNKRILLIPNGYNEEDKKIVNDLRSIESKNTEIKKDEIKFICAGKFSEYGVEKVKLIIDKIYQQYTNINIILTLVGANTQENNWVYKYIKQKNYKNITFYLLDRVQKKELYSLILKHDIAIALIRDPDYDFGTKVFGYILCSKPIFNYFDVDNNFTKYFKNYFTLGESIFSNSFLRSDLLEKEKENLLKVLK